MKNIQIIFLLFLSTVFAQVSMSDINKLSNQQLDAIKAELQSGEKATTIESITSEGLDESVPVAITSTPVAVATGDYFGYNYLKKDISFFDNIPTPADYKLGPGDEIIISLWGENNSRTNITINKDGMIYYENIGFINLSNKTLASAEVLLTEELSRIYSTLKDKNNPTKLMLELGKLKSINIYFSGHIENPGINLVHPFSDIFSAIVQAGGINDKGSLREIQLIRNGKIIDKVDFYSFFMDGKNNFSNIKLIDGDVIHIPNVKNRVLISGEVNRSSTYELLLNESISDIIGYASGFTSDASSTLILSQVIPVKERSSDDNARTSIAVNFKSAELTILNNGDSINVLSIPSVDSEVIVYGRVKSPGKYPAMNNTLKNILDIAGGFDDPIFRKTIREDELLILRQDSNKFYSTQIAVSYKDADQFKLEQNDKIFVYEDINYKNNPIYRVEGQVFKPGTYPIGKDKITLREALSLAGGLTELSSEKNLTIKQEFTTVDDAGNEITTSEPVSNVTLDFEIGSNSVIIASPFENVVRVEGNVYNPGLVAYDRGLTMSEAIVQAGGYKPYSMKKGAYVQKANGEIDKTNLFRGRTRRLSPGDTVIVPLDPDPNDFDITAFISDLSTTLANIAAILLIVDNQTK
ncbi:SLBB domain-containing protein [Candidatus Marinimicrobia bacterium]|nr:SLBB domain-containing protein [Candidatus Neomarinimicrobiota bacterium]